MRNRLRNRKHLIWIAPLAMVGIAIFIFVGGEIVKVLWNWLAPSLFGLRLITFWQALGLLVLCRILFGGFGMSGNASRRSRRQMFERWEQMTPEERERFRQRLYGRAGRTSPLDSNETA